MKKIIFSILLALPICLFGQIGIKAGLNFANVTKAAAINNKSQTGFHAGLILAPATSKIMGFRTELSFSKQGYDYKSSTNTGSVNLNYIMSSNLTTISITKYFQIQLGMQTAYLLNAKVDSTAAAANPADPTAKIMDMYNRFDYGFAGGVEIHPVAGLLLGARVNISLGSLYKDALSGQMPSFSSIDIKNNVFQLFAGWRFGKQASVSKKKDK